MQSPKVSIIIASYNRGDTLEKCLLSVIHQGYSNKELIIIDGKSTDSTINIIEKYKTQITYYCSEQDKGIYDAMNKGILKSTGEWLYFLGADDSFYDDNVLSTIFQNHNIEQYDFIYGNVYVAKFNAIYDGEYDFDKFAKQPMNHQATFTKKKIFEKFGYFNIKYKVSADNHFISKFFFDRNINRKFIPVIVANYSFGGFSNIIFDNKYTYDKPYLLIRYGQESVSKKVMVEYGFRQAVFMNFSYNKFHLAIIEWFRYFFYAVISGSLIYFIKKDFKKIF